MARDKVVCPACRSETDWLGNPNRPFCSRKCKMEDLHNWMSNRYSIPGAPQNPDAGEEESDR